MSEPIVQLGDVRRRQPAADMTFVDGMWTVTRSVGGAPIKFEAPTREALSDLIQMTIDQHMNPEMQQFTFEDLRKKLEKGNNEG
jgi:hypothetical protein